MTVLHNQITLNATTDKVLDVFQKISFLMIQVEQTRLFRNLPALGIFVSQQLSHPGHSDRHRDVIQFLSMH